MTVNCANFYDEDGEPMMWRDVLEGVLKPLGYRMVQRHGKIIIYDVNAIVKRGPGNTSEWAGTDAVLGTAPIYNKVTITYSPYCKSENLLPETTYRGKTDKTVQPLYEDRDESAYVEADESEKNAGLGFSVTKDTSTVWLKGDVPDIGAVEFNCFLGGGLSGAILNPQGYETFKIGDKYAPGDFRCRSAMFIPVNGGAMETPAVIYDPIIHDSTTKRSNRNFRPQRSLYCPDYWYDGWKSNEYNRKLNRWDAWANPDVPTMLFRTKRIYLPPMQEADAQKTYIRIKQPLLCDVRYNPFNQEGENNEEDAVKCLKGDGCPLTRWLFLRADVLLFETGSTGGEPFKRYSNVIDSDDKVAQGGEVGNLTFAKGAWKSASAATAYSTYLEYYDPDDPDSYNIGGGWKNNRQCVGRPDNLAVRSTEMLGDSIQSDTKQKIKGREFYFFDEFKRLEDGEYIPYPKDGGWLEYRVCNSIQGHCKGTTELRYTTNGTSWSTPAMSTDLSICQWNSREFPMYNLLRWIAFGVPEIDIVNAYAPYELASQDDIEYSGELMKSATEELKIETICGSALDASPTSRGTYTLSYLYAIKKAKMDTIEGELEELLLGRYISNLSQPRKTLTGEIDNQDRNLTQVTVWHDPADSADYLLTSETEDCLECTSQVKLTQAYTDNYNGHE